MTKIAIPIVCISPSQKQGIILVTSNFSMGKDTFQLPVHVHVTSVDWPIYLKLDPLIRSLISLLKDLTKPLFNQKTAYASA